MNRSLISHSLNRDIANTDNPIELRRLASIASDLGYSHIAAVAHEIAESIEDADRAHANACKAFRNRNGYR